MHLLGKPFEKIVEILERHARSILTLTWTQIGTEQSNEARPYEGITGSLDISVLAYVLEKMSNIVDSSTPSKALFFSLELRTTLAVFDEPTSHPSDYRRPLCFCGFRGRRFHQSVVEKLRREHDSTKIPSFKNLRSTRLPPR